MVFLWILVAKSIYSFVSLAFKDASPQNYIDLLMPLTFDSFLLLQLTRRVYKKAVLVVVNDAYIIIL